MALINSIFTLWKEGSKPLGNFEVCACSREFVFGRQFCFPLLVGDGLTMGDWTCNSRGCTELGTLKCEGCKTVRYCTRECRDRQQHWNSGHSVSCKILERTQLPGSKIANNDSGRHRGLTVAVPVSLPLSRLCLLRELGEIGNAYRRKAGYTFTSGTYAIEQSLQDRFIMTKLLNAVSPPPLINGPEAGAGAGARAAHVPSTDLLPSVVYDTSKAVISVSISCDNVHVCVGHGDHTVKVFQLSDNALVRYDLILLA